jgi:hypothetical protein
LSNAKLHAALIALDSALRFMTDLTAESPDCAMVIGQAETLTSLLQILFLSHHQLQNESSLSQGAISGTDLSAQTSSAPIPNASLGIVVLTLALLTNLIRNSDSSTEQLVDLSKPLQSHVQLRINIVSFKIEFRIGCTEPFPCSCMGRLSALQHVTTMYATLIQSSVSMSNFYSYHD